MLVFKKTFTKIEPSNLKYYMDCTERLLKQNKQNQQQKHTKKLQTLNQVLWQTVNTLMEWGIHMGLHCLSRQIFRVNNISCNLKLFHSTLIYTLARPHFIVLTVSPPVMTCLLLSSAYVLRLPILQTIWTQIRLLPSPKGAV